MATSLSVVVTSATVTVTSGDSQRPQVGMTAGSHRLMLRELYRLYFEEGVKRQCAYVVADRRPHV